MKAFQRRSTGQGRPLGPDVARGFGVARGLQWACGLSLAVGLMATAHASAAPQVPEGLTGAEWSGIQAQISETRDAMAYEATRRGDDWVATNPAHGFSIRYAEKGHTELELTGGDAKPHRIALKPRSVGYAGGEALSLIEPLARDAEGETVTTQWSSELSEWWVNSDKGLEQWFELTERPKASTDPDAPLVVNLELDSTLQANLRGEGSHQFLHLSGPETSVHFEKLKVFDANGGDVPATLRLDGKVLSYVIDDRQADYPLTIDPTFTQQQRLDQGADGTDDDDFGFSVDISGDVLVIGANAEASSTNQIDGPRDDDQPGTGAAFVFRLEDGAWVEKAFLKAPDGAVGANFGWSVAISANTVVVGAPDTDSFKGQVYAFLCDFEAT
ncbi:MAG: hypothetical protein RI549_07995, partial [Wenzhouxiangella sp.]|nr:hypothetical protein [Wenzhouxiangella sp.]